jgi:hypothetical protein
MIRGQWFFVNPDVTADSTQNWWPGSTSNDGVSMQAPMDSMVTAYNACISGRGDGICLLGGGTSTAENTSYLTEALTWSKSGITTYGVSAPVRTSMRSRVANKSTAVSLANLIDLTGANNSFYNTQMWNGGTTGAGGLKLTGGLRNYFQNCHISGGMGMTVPTINDYDLYMDAAENNTFVGCTFGDDTFDKSDVAGASLFFANLCGKNFWINCNFLAYRSAQTAAPGMIKMVGAGNSIFRSQFFDNCLFSLYDEGAMAASTACVIGTMPNNGLLVMNESKIIGFADWAAAANARVIVFNSASSTDGQRAIAANAS